MQLKEQLSRAEAYSVWPETQCTCTTVPSGQMHGQPIPLSRSLLLCFSSISFPPSLFLTTQPHYGGTLMLNCDPCPICTTDTNTNRFWWSPWGPSEAAVFIVERMYRVIGLNHWLPLFQLGACTVNYWQVNVRADCVLKGVSGLDSRLQFSLSLCISLTPRKSIYTICVSLSWVFCTFPLWLTYLKQLL